MRKTTPEPGFAQAYQFFVVIRVLFWVAVGPVLILLQMSGNPVQADEQLARTALIQRMSLPNTWPVLGVDLLLLAVLLWRQSPQYLKSWFVPLTLIWGLLPLLLGYYWWPAENPLQSPFVMFFFVMAVLIAWEYGYGLVSLYVVALAVYEVLLSPKPSTVPWTVPVSWVVLQAVMMLLASWVTATLASVQRQQRAALADAYQRQAAANQRLQQYAAAVEELTISRERNRLARELHDTLAHSLSALTVQLEAVRTLWPTQPDKARGILEQADDTARTGLAEARRALQALRAAPLDDLGLLVAVQELAETAARRAGATLDLQLPPQLQTCPSPAIEQGIYRVAQETLENVVRHARAHTILVRLVEEGGRLELTIQDDGCGIDLAALTESDDADDERQGGHLGLRGMQERARLIASQLDITSETGRGTSVRLIVPVERQADGTGPDL